ncbi:MAG: efflux RND transporter periplasmic adaptor subunit [Acidobacteria bacterium]|nr:efflux RND transporter periplasmic adaptor subunit [Acidobacteriota bacterium]MCI0724658.1 efflux RND transporter periplasmic adaptor subunit [Acidobacteriota bacterium]
MSKTKKIVIGSVAALVISIGGYGYYKAQDAKIPRVQTGKVIKMESLVQTVSASGEIKPLKYINITANSFGRIIEIAVKEGDHVKQGDLLLRQESVQSSADLRSAQALLQQVTDDQEGSEAAYRSSEATLKTQQAELLRAQADLEKARLDFERSQNLLKEGLISKSQFDQAQAAFEVAKASTESARARLQQSQAQLNQADKARVSARSRIAQQKAGITRVSDQVSKTIYVAPLTGVITNLPVHVGESAVPGIQNSIGSNLMTLADLSVITAEVKVDETDIVNVKLGQEAEVTVDAISNKVFKGKVTEVGSSALTRSGQAAGSGVTNTTSQEAKDFKVVVTLLEPTAQLKPGLSTTAKITTATRQNVLAIPIQALTIREAGKDKENQVPSANPDTARASGKSDAPQKEGTVSSSKTSKKKEEQGVFIVRDGKAVFVPVTSGITGQTEIEVLSGLKEGDEIVTGSYKTLRTLKTDTKIKVDNKEAGNGEKKS